MKKLLYIPAPVFLSGLLFFSSSSLAHLPAEALAQAGNLVPNPSFENYCQCPWDQGSVYLAYGWHSYAHSPDYFNACDTNLPPTFSVPYNAWGYQYAAHGYAYTGLGIYNITVNDREYIGSHLMNSLDIGQKYYVSFEICSAEICELGSDKMGILFSTISYAIDSIVDSTYCFSNFFPPSNNDPVVGISNLIPIKPHIFTNTVVTDTANWTTITGSFIADSAYEYIMIGNFFDKDSLNFMVSNSSSPNKNFVYYFIDEIYVGTDSLSGNNEYEFDNLINVFPNPIIRGETVNVQLPAQHQNASAKIYSIVGNLISQQELYGGNNILALNNLTRGIYFISINTSNRIINKYLIIY